MYIVGVWVLFNYRILAYPYAVYPETRGESNTHTQHTQSAVSVEPKIDQLLLTYQGISEQDHALLSVRSFKVGFSENPRTS